MVMRFQSVDEVMTRREGVEFLQFEERDPCYTWLFPLRLGPFDMLRAWAPTSLPRLTDNLTLYVHIPYCRFICSMCPFTHEPLMKRDLTSYVAALLEEIRIYSQHPSAKGRRVTTLYFGGGTASSLTPDQVAMILDAIRSGFSLEPSCEITLECHPRTVDRNYLAQVRSLGVGRVSFGIQSFQQRNIDLLKLHQKVEQSREILETAIDLGFQTVAMDLMYRYPDQRVEDLEAEIDTALAIGIHGISVYSLDPVVRGMSSVASRQVPVAIEADMYYYLHDRLHDAGFVHVAQPDYARISHENMQLRDLWGAPQAENLGFGAGAFSESFNGATWANLQNSNDYIEAVSRGELPVLMGQSHSWDDAAARYPALGVRCLSVPLQPFETSFGTSLRELYRLELEALERRGLTTFDEERLWVTRRGKFFIDNISKAFFNLANRGKPQLWGHDLRTLRAPIARRSEEALRVMESYTWE
ncbi:MAG TPA: coproporphyrinogen-III oxidase family protein [Nitrospira sp.]